MSAPRFPAVAAHRGPRVAPGPAEALGPLAQAGDQAVRAPLRAGLGVDLGLVARPQRHRVEIYGVCRDCRQRELGVL